MSDFLDRERWERRLYGAIQDVQRVHLDRVMGTLREVGGWSGTSPEMSRAYETDLRAALFPLLEGVYMDAARQTLGESAIGVDWTLVNQRAADWAQQYGFDLVRKIDNTTTTRLQSAFARYFEEQRTMGLLRADIEKFIPDLRDRLGRFIFAKERSAMIAVTEVTNISAEGQLGLLNEVNQENPDVIMDGFWQTNNDEIVHRCPICWPLHGQKKVGGPQGYYIHPVTKRIIKRPGSFAHVRCRCWENYTLRLPSRRNG